MLFNNETGSKRINIEDTVKRFDAEQVSCFEKPIAIILNYYKEKAGDMYIAFSKLCSIYNISEKADVKQYIMDFMDEDMGMLLAPVSRIRMTHGSIVEFINDGMPLISAINLKYLPCSEHFEGDDWAHWVIISGYSDNKLVDIFDNSQFDVLGHEYEVMQINSKELSKLNKRYNECISTDYSYFYIIDEDKFNLDEITNKIIEKLLASDYKDNDCYRQKAILEEIIKVSKIREEWVDGVIEQLKKNLSIINVYRGVLCDILSERMLEKGYSNKKLDELKELNDKIKHEWDSFILKKTLEISENSIEEIIIDEKLIALESIFRKYIDDFSNFLKGKKNKISKLEDMLKKIDNIVDESVCEEIIEDSLENDDEDVEDILEQAERYFDIEKSYEETGEFLYEIENDEDLVININDEKDVVKFWFDNENLHNWWIEDDAPKVILFRDNIEQKKLLCKATIEIEDSCTEENFEAGIFVRNANNEKWLDKEFFGAYENNGNYNLSEIGKIKQEEKYKKSNIMTIYMEVEGNNIDFGYIDKNDSKNKLLSTEYNNVGLTEVGLAVKTWGNGGKLDIKFKNMIIEI